MDTCLMKKTKTPVSAGKLTLKIIGYTLLYLVLTAGAITMIYPYAWMLSTAFKSTEEVVNNFAVYLIPKDFTFSNFSRLLSIIPFFRGLLNTMLIEISVLTVGTFTTTLGAFAFAKMRFPGKDKIFLVLLSGMMIPFVVVLTPQFSAYTSLNMLDTLWPLIIPGLLGNVSMLFFLRQYMKGIPDQLFEAAKVEGASYFRMYWRIMLPLAIPAIGTQVIFWFLGIWNDILAPDIYLTMLEHKTLQVMLKYLDNQSGGGTLRYQPLTMAGALISSLPILVLYMCFQKYFVNSMAMSGLKD